MLTFFNDEMKKFNKFLKVKNQPIKGLEWSLPYEVIIDLGKIRLLKFTKGKTGVPILFVPPEAGHDSHIVDYGKDQSLIELAVNNYYGDVFVIEKLSANNYNQNYNLSSLMILLELIVSNVINFSEFNGEKVHLIGLCQGGWEIAIYTALFPNKVASLTLAASPIDFQAGDGIIKRIVNITPQFFFENLVKTSDGVMPGSFIVLDFIMMHPYERFVSDDFNLYNAIESEEEIERFSRFTQWYHKTQDLPGPLYLEIVKKLFRENQFIKKELELLGKKVDPENIDCPIIWIGGEKDDITPIPQLKAIEEYVSSKDITGYEVPYGHIGVFMSKGVIRDYWPKIIDKLNSI